MKELPAGVRNKEAKGEFHSIADGTPATMPTFPPRLQNPPSFRLNSTRQMNVSDQQRFELLLGLLIERRVARLLEKMK